MPPPSHPNIEVRGEAMNLFIAAFDVFPSLAQKYLVQRGFAEADRTGRLFPSRAFIPLDLWLETFDAVLADIGPNALFKIGQRIIGNPHFPGTVPDLEGALRMIDVAYHMSHRKGGTPMFERGATKMLEGIGHYSVQRTGKEKKIIVQCDTPYPCPLEHGMVAGVSGQFEPRAIVTHEDLAKCRLKGGARCSYVVSW